jgi:hypothetical protein
MSLSSVWWVMLGLLVLVEQHDHQAGAAAEPAEQGALAGDERDPGLR